jgi:acyl dehydratase
MPLNKDLVGKRYEESTYEVTANAIEKYARATNDENPRYLSGEVVGSPVFPVVPVFGSFMAAAMDPELGADLMRLVHGAEEHVLHRPLRPGDVLTVAPVLESVEQKDTGETFTVHAAITDPAGAPVADIRGTMFIRGSGSGMRSRGGEEPRHKVIYEETTKIDEDQTHRYADASGDHNPIHLDPEMARMAGLRGIINHGMCTMAIAVKGAVNGLAGGDPERVKRVAVRFARPVFPGQELTTKFWSDSETGDVMIYGFETFNPDGIAVIKNGVAEVVSA